jgi:hypothetical protein
VPNLASVFLRDPAEGLFNELLTARPDSGCVRLVRRPHRVVRLIQAKRIEKYRLVDEGALNAGSSSHHGEFNSFSPTADPLPRVASSHLSRLMLRSRASRCTGQSRSVLHSGRWLSQKGVRIMGGVDITGQMPRGASKVDITFHWRSCGTLSRPTLPCTVQLPMRAGCRHDLPQRARGGRGKFSVLLPRWVGVEY